MRHSHVAQMLADHYDVRRLRTYRTSPSLERFFPHFVDAIRHLADDVANAYITSGELILDVALLRSIDDFVADPLSAQAMELINRDESRHIAIDYHMVGYYASDEYKRARTKTKVSLREQAVAARTFAAMTLWGRPFFRDVFFGPMDRIDPTGERLREAFKRMQLLGTRPGPRGAAAHEVLVVDDGALQPAVDGPHRKGSGRARGRRGAALHGVPRDGRGARAREGDVARRARRRSPRREAD